MLDQLGVRWDARFALGSSTHGHLGSNTESGAWCPRHVRPCPYGPMPHMQVLCASRKKSRILMSRRNDSTGSAVQKPLLRSRLRAKHQIADCGRPLVCGRRCFVSVSFRKKCAVKRRVNLLTRLSLLQSDPPQPATRNLARNRP